MKVKAYLLSLSVFERRLWVGSLIAIVLSFFMAEGGHWMTLAASLIGATALIFVAKGNVFGQILTVVFSLLYAVISYDLRYYGEMITYLGMTAPIAVLSVISWMRHPYEGEQAEVEVNTLGRRNIWIMVLAAGVVTTLFYFILDAFGTANITISTISITTSFLASYLMFMRSCTYALAYAANDVVLIILWVCAAMSNLAYLPMVICFVIFFLNDMYGFYNWLRIKKRQAAV